MDKILAKTLFVGKKSIYLPECHSTNDIAGELIKKGHNFNGMVVYTDFQSSGKGQRGNTWESQKGENLMFSVIFKCSFLHLGQQFKLHQLAAISIAEVLKKYLRNVKIKWPNDIMVGDKKICGILIENNIRGNRLEETIIGIGLNVNQASFSSNRATSLLELTGVKFSRETVLDQLLEGIEANYLKLKSGEFSALQEKYLSMQYRMGESRLYEDAAGPFVGKIVNITDEGKLQIDHNGEVNDYEFKEVRFIID